MTIEEIREVCLSMKGATEGLPFGDEYLVFKVGGKMFLLIPLEHYTTTFFVKTDPEWSVELREQYPQIKGAFHLNKTHWNSVETEGVPKKLILKLIQHSYDLVFNKLTQKVRESILNQ